MDPRTHSPPGDPAWPEQLRWIFDSSLVAEFATLTATGSPVTVPTTPFVETGKRTIDVSTGLTYPAKAERARRDPRVCLLFADPIGSDLRDPTVVAVQGLATVRDSDLQANTDRYVRLSTQKLPATTARAPRIVLRRLVWYYARIWIEITPLHMRWWPSRALAGPASQWNALEGTAAPLSDPAPSGKQPTPWLAPPKGWREVAARALTRSFLCDLTVVDSNGFPLCMPVSSLELETDGMLVELGPGAPPLAGGRACVTLHSHAEVFAGQENRTFVGTLTRDVVETGTSDKPSSWHFRVDRALAHWSLPGGPLSVAAGFLWKGRVLSRRLDLEAKRRLQSTPVVRFPDES